MTATVAIPTQNAENVYSLRTTFMIWRLFALAGPLYATVGLIFWALIAGFLPAPNESWSANQIANWFQQDDTRIRVGLVGYIAIAPFYLVWSIVISRVIQRIEGPDGLLGTMEFVGGIATSAVTAGSGVFWLVAAFRAGERSPQDVQMLNDIGWFIFDMTFMATFLQMCAVGAAIILDRRQRPFMPPWLAWASFLCAATFLPLVVLPFVQTGPFAWQGMFNYFIALGAFFIWLYVLAFYVYKAIGRVEQETVG
ncbi:MAG: hypothetical protein JWR83_537 [Aeromicrobium sp.]|nr:hypothetical protein [Aeromicrobium sp.]